MAKSEEFKKIIEKHGFTAAQEREPSEEERNKFENLKNLVQEIATRISEKNPSFSGKEVDTALLSFILKGLVLSDETSAE